MRISDWSSDVCSSDLRFEVQHVKTVSAGGKTETGPWKLRYEGAYAYADEQEHGSIDPITFRHKFEEPGELGVTFDYARLGRPGYAIDAGEAAFFDPAVYEFRSEEHTSELQSLMRISYAVFCLKKKTTDQQDRTHTHN